MDSVNSVKPLNIAGDEERSVPIEVRSVLFLLSLSLIGGFDVIRMLIVTLFQVLPGLFVGNLRASKNREFLDQHGITHVLTVASEIEPEFPKRYSYKIINVDDSTEDDL